MLAGDATAALAELDEAHELGIDPTQLLRGLMEGAPLGDPGQGRSGRATRSSRPRSARPPQEMAGKLSWGTIHRLWQMLLKGLQDVAIAPDPREAAEMALLRLIHAADMPDPAALMARLSGEGSAAASARGSSAAGNGPTAPAAGGFPGAGQAVRSGAASISSRSSSTTRSAWSATRRPSWC